MIGGQLVISGTITLGTMVALATYVARVYGPLTALTNARVDIMSAFVSFERVFEVLDTPNAIVDAPDAIDLVAPSGRIELDDVWFRYPAASEVSVASLESDPTSGRPLPDTPGAFVLRGVGATIEPGQLVALVGPSGGGKTTISNLIPRLYDFFLKSKFRCQVARVRFSDLRQHRDRLSIQRMIHKGNDDFAMPSVDRH